MFKQYKINYNVKKMPEHNDLLKLLKLAAEDTKIEGKFEVSFNLVDSEEIKKINKEYRNVNKPTDVLSFPQMETFNKVTDMGDIFINKDIIESQAKEIGSDPSTEIKFLFMHGLLHLIGYDHVKEKDYSIMRKKEKEFFKKANIR
jgi:probable rRNA maturation factor